MKLGKSRLFALAAAHGASLLAVPAVLQAAENPAATGQLEEIVVTARQREEKIEDVPVTITAFTQTEIKNAGIERPQDFIALTSGVSVVQTAEAGDMQVNIRGINTGRDAETNFALVVDGVLQTNPNALNQELSGVTQIEILKGPQGALYGRNAVAGAMIITTRKPGDEWGSEVKAGYGTDNTYNASFYTGGPLGAGGVKGSLSAYTRNTDGQFKNSYLGCNDCVDFFEESGVNGRLLFPIARRRPGLQGEVLEDRLRRDQLQCLDRAEGRVRHSRRPAAERGPERSQVRLPEQHQAEERAGERQPVAQGRLGRRRRHVDELPRLQRPDQLLPDGRHERGFRTVRIRIRSARPRSPRARPTRRCRRRSTTATTAKAGRTLRTPSCRHTARPPATATSTSSVTRRTPASRSA